MVISLKKKFFRPPDGPKLVRLTEGGGWESLREFNSLSSFLCLASVFADFLASNLTV
jgi:hypothetical protein